MTDVEIEIPPLILAATEWPTNAELIAAVAELGWLKATDHVLDPTYAKGTWWNVWRPERMTTHTRAKDGTDFRHLPYPDDHFDAVAYDPPYVAPGGRSTSTIKEMHDRYGMNEGGAADPDFKNPLELQAIINDGLTEMVRVVRKPRKKHEGGIVLVKCMNYVWGGHLHPGAMLTWQHAVSLGCRLVDQFYMLGEGGPQPTLNNDGSPRRQVHTRNNLSVLWVLRAPQHKAKQETLL